MIPSAGAEGGGGRSFISHNCTIAEPGPQLIRAGYNHPGTIIAGSPVVQFDDMLLGAGSVQFDPGRQGDRQIRFDGVVVGQGDIVAAGDVEGQSSVNFAGGVDIFGVLLGGGGNIVSGAVHDIGVGGIVVHAPVAHGPADIAVFVGYIMHIGQVHALAIIDRQAIAQMIVS